MSAYQSHFQLKFKNFLYIKFFFNAQTLSVNEQL